MTMTKDSILRSASVALSWLAFTAFAITSDEKGYNKISLCDKIHDIKKKNSPSAATTTSETTLSLFSSISHFC